MSSTWAAPAGPPRIGGNQTISGTNAVVLPLDALLLVHPAELSLRGERQDGNIACETSQGQEVPVLLDLVPLASSSGLHETLALLTSQLRPDSNHREEMGFLRDVFSEKSLGYLMKVNAAGSASPMPKGGSSCASQPLPCP